MRTPQNRKHLGDLGEQIVEDHLKAQGYVILAKNHRSRLGELDLVARKEQDYYFIEVKSRRSSDCGLAEISWRQRQRLTRMAYKFLSTIAESIHSARFMVVLVWFGDGEPVLEWLEEGFDASF